jgi:hypothetical protein
VAPPSRSSARHADGVAVVEPRRDLVLDQVVERVGLDVVARGRVLDAVGRRDRPAVVAVVPLVPPAVEDRQVRPPLSAAFMPDVPQASYGRSGLFSQTSHPG